MSLYIYKNRPSASARLLRKRLKAKIIGSNIPPITATVINWGCSSIPTWGGCEVINKASAVNLHTNKLTFLETYYNTCRCVPFCLTPEGASEYFSGKIVVRNLLTSHSGHGIMILEPGQEVPEAPLYTKYIPKSAEYRVHFFQGKSIDVQRKIRDPDKEPTNWQVRSHENGFIYVRNNVVLPPDAEAEALKFIQATSLDFGALDILIGKADGLAYILEVNTAPGLTGTTLEKYVEAFQNL